MNTPNNKGEKRGGGEREGEVTGKEDGMSNQKQYWTQSSINTDGGEPHKQYAKKKLYTVRRKIPLPRTP